MIIIFLIRLWKTENWLYIVFRIWYMLSKYVYFNMDGANSSLCYCFGAIIYDNTHTLTYHIHSGHVENKNILLSFFSPFFAKPCLSSLIWLATFWSTVFIIILYIINFFSVNLSIADTMVSSLNVTFNFVYMLNGHWPFGNIYCKVCSFISIISVCGSVFTMVAISVDR